MKFHGNQHPTVSEFEFLIAGLPCVIKWSCHFADMHCNNRLKAFFYTMSDDVSALRDKRLCVEQQSSLDLDCSKCFF